MGDNADADDDGDDFTDEVEITCESDPKDSISIPVILILTANVIRRMTMMTTMDGVTSMRLLVIKILYQKQVSLLIQTKMEYAII